MPNPLKITVENPDEILNTGHSGAGAVIQIQSSPDGTTWNDDGTVAIVAATRTYTYYDSDGAATTWYRLRYETTLGAPTSDWSDPFQAGDEEGGLICSIYDVEQLTGSLPDSDREQAIERIRAVTTEIEGYTRRDFTGDKSDRTWRVHTRSGRVLFYPRGLQSVTTLRVATSHQPQTGGTYDTVTATDYYLAPLEPEDGWPYTRIEFLPEATGTVTMFEWATFGAEITGRRGFRSVPADVAQVAAELVRDGWLTKGTASADQAVVGPNGTPVILRDPRHRAVLDRYRVVEVG